MKPVIDLEKTYGIVFDGGGARGAYQIGAWKAMREAGVKISAVAGTSVGALNGALVCMGDLERAEKIWEKITFSRVMDVDDQIMQELFDRKLPLHEAIHEVLTVIKNGGVDVTPLRELIHEMVDEEKIRQSKIAFYLLTFSLSDMKELELGIEDIPEGLLEDFLLASAYLLGFKNEELHGKKYMDGGVINNVPLGTLVERGYQNIIEVRIFGPGREPRVYLPNDVTVYEIAPRVKLGSIIEFQEKIGAWKAMREAGVKISAVAGTSVGALNGALVCMGDLERAEKIWEKITFSRVMDVDDQIMQELFDRKLPLHEAIHEVLTVIKNGGVDVTPLRELIHEMVDEEKIRQSKIAFYLLTFSLSDMKELELGIEDIPEGLLEDFLLASAYLLGFKNEELHGKKYMDGGVINNVPLGTLVERGYQNIIEVRIFGPGREPRVYLPNDVTVYEIAPRVKLGSIIEFQEKRSRQNMKIGYYDAKRVIYGLAGTIYYIEQTKEEWYYEKKFEGLTEHDRREIAFWLKLPLRTKEAELYLAMLEASAKYLHVPKYRIYTVEELFDLVKEKYEKKDNKERTKEAELYLAMLEASAKYLHVPKYRIYTVEELFDLVKEKYEKKDNKEAVPYFTELLLAMGKEE